ncbi:MAG: amino acid permease, partial [Firmicutes bacterium]|nr:amino acid permease [Bacillota bacterium]
MWRIVKRLLIGRPLPTWAQETERIGVARALAVLSADALSSVAYATEETLIVLVAAGFTQTAVVLPISLAIVGLLALLALSYRQVIFAYPSGGG